MNDFLKPFGELVGGVTLLLVILAIIVANHAAGRRTEAILMFVNVLIVPLGLLIIAAVIASCAS